MSIYCQDNFATATLLRVPVKQSGTTIKSERPSWPLCRFHIPIIFSRHPALRIHLVVALPSQRSMPLASGKDRNQPCACTPVSSFRLKLHHCHFSWNLPAYGWIDGIHKAMIHVVCLHLYVAVTTALVDTYHNLNAGGGTCWPVQTNEVIS
jgi:hypothetical protein